MAPGVAVVQLPREERRAETEQRHQRARRRARSTRAGASNASARSRRATVGGAAVRSRPAGAVTTGAAARAAVVLAPRPVVRQHAVRGRRARRTSEPRRDRRSCRGGVAWRGPGTRGRSRRRSPTRRRRALRRGRCRPGASVGTAPRYRRELSRPSAPPRSGVTFILGTYSPPSTARASPWNFARSSCAHVGARAREPQHRLGAAAQARHRLGRERGGVEVHESERHPGILARRGPRVGDRAAATSERRRARTRSRTVSRTSRPVCSAIEVRNSGRRYRRARDSARAPRATRSRARARPTRRRSGSRPTPPRRGRTARPTTPPGPDGSRNTQRFAASRTASSVASPTWRWSAMLRCPPPHVSW